MGGIKSWTSAETPYHAIKPEHSSGPPTWWIGKCEGGIIIVKLEHWQKCGLAGFEMVFFTQHGVSVPHLPSEISDLNGFDFAELVARGEFQRLEPEPSARPATMSEAQIPEEKSQRALWVYNWERNEPLSLEVREVVRRSNKWCNLAVLVYARRRHLQ